MPYQRYNSNNRNRRPNNNSSHGRSGGSNRRKKDYINPELFIKKAKPVTEIKYIPKNKFSDFKLHPILKNNISVMNFVDPTPIQDLAIPPGLEAKDIVGIANTGTGKTATFAIPVLNRLISEPNAKALIMAPTRELAEQIEQQCRALGKGTNLNGALLIGGSSMGLQLKELRYNPRIVIGTPGRIKDHISRRSLPISEFNIVVLDEVDRMLDMGFINDIQEIISQTSNNRQGFYFSATLDKKVKTIIDNFSKDPVHISVKSQETNDNIDQNVIMYRSHENNKLDKLHSILTSDQASKIIIFDDTHRSVEKLSKELDLRGFNVDSIHGGKSQSQRQNVLRKFKKSEINVLVATDVAARGLDVSDISHVINYSLPQSYDDYVHRIGRTGRAGSVGVALTFVEK